MINRTIRAALTMALACLPVSALAQAVQAPNYQKGAAVTSADGMFLLDQTGRPLGTSTNPVTVTCTSGCTSSGGSGGAVTQSGAWSVGLTGTLPGFAAPPTINLGSTDSGNLASVVSTLATAVSTLSSELTALTTLSGAVNAPIPAQATHQVLIGGVEGTTAAGTASPYPVTIQGNASGVAVPVSGATTVATNSSGAISIVQGDSSAAINVATAATTQLVALVSGKAIYVTGWDVLVSAADNVTLEYGTGTNCATGTTALTGAYNLAANGGLVAGGNLGMVFKVPAGNALCLVTSTAAQASGRVTYAQF